MTSQRPGIAHKAGKVWRVFWTIASVTVVASVVFGVAVLPAAYFWSWHFRWDIQATWVRIFVQSIAFVPSYVIFAFSLMILSALSARVTGWRTPANTQLPIANLDWPLLNWVRYSILNHLVRIFAGTFFRATPLWTFYMRLNGARLGRNVHVNSLWVSDHCLLDFADGVVIGGGVHLSGHTVERGIVKTAPVRLAQNVTVGVGAVIEIGVEAGPGCQIGALALVPKFAKLDARRVYVGIPARKLKRLGGESQPE